MRRLLLLIALLSVTLDAQVIRNVGDPDNAPRITTTSLDAGTDDVSYTEQIDLQAGVGRAPMTYAITSGALPDGLSLNSSTGAITGTPTVAGTFNFTVRVVDVRGGTHEQKLSIVIAAGGGSGTPVFQSTWEGQATGCTLNGIKDTWDDFGPNFPGVCSVSGWSDPIQLQVVSTPVHGGTRAMQVHFEDDKSVNGPGFIAGADNLGPYTTIYVRWWQRWNSNWKWSPDSDHKMWIQGVAGGGQDVYFNVCGNSGGTTGRACIHAIAEGTVYTDTAVTFTPNTWNRFDLKVTTGANGSLTAKINGTLLTLTRERGTGSTDPNDVSISGPHGNFKVDATYNDFQGYFVPQVGNSYFHLDDVAVCTGDWCP